MDYTFCRICNGAGWVPNPDGTGDQAGGWADTCKCQRPPESEAAPLPPRRPQPPLTLSDTAELAAEISAQDGVPLDEALELAGRHLERLTRGATMPRLAGRVLAWGRR